MTSSTLAGARGQAGTTRAACTAKRRRSSLLDDPTLPLSRADLIVQDEVATKRATVPPSTLLSTVWAPWWDDQPGRRVPGRAFRPVPRVDAAVLIVRRREYALLPTAMAGPYASSCELTGPFRVTEITHRGDCIPRDGARWYPGAACVEAAMKLGMASPRSMKLRLHRLKRWTRGI